MNAIIREKWGSDLTRLDVVSANAFIATLRICINNKVLQPFD